MAAQKKKKTFKKNTAHKHLFKDEVSKNLPEDIENKTELEEQESQKKDQIPTIGLDDELAIEKNQSGEGSADVPKINLDDQIAIDKKNLKAEDKKSEIPKISRNAKLKIEDFGAGKTINVPAINPDAKLKIEDSQNQQSEEIPDIDPEAKLKIEDSQNQGEKVVPTVDPATPLAIEQKTGFEMNRKQDDKSSDMHLEDNTGEEKRGFGGEMFLVVLLIVLLAIISGIGFFYFKSISLQDKEAMNQQTVPQQVTEREFVRKNWQIEVLNGTTKAGEAKKLADYLEGKGYKIIKAANAQNSDYKQSEVFVANDLSASSKYLLDDLGDWIKVPEETQELKDSTASARIIIGRD